YSFLEFYHTPLYGDMEGGIVPAKDVQEIFNDPTGIKAIITNKEHVNPNRFFSHFLFMEYFRKVPMLLQYFFEPITSVYLSCAIAKILVQFFLIYLLTTTITNEKNILNLKFLLVAALISPLFQTHGYWSRMGIIDISTAYTFFYAVPLLFLLLFIKPVYQKLYNLDNKPFGKKLYYLIPLVFILPLSGPLIPGVILIFSALLFTHYIIDFRKHSNHSADAIHLFFKEIPKDVLFIVLSVSLVSLYALFLKFYDSNYDAASIPLIERYLKLPVGLYSQITHSFGIPLMLAIIGINLVIIHKKFKTNEAEKIIRTVKWIGLFSAIYIFLLPLGGYRPYRPNIIRYDTFMPVTICLFFVLGATTYFLYGKMKSKKYWIFIITSMLIYTFADISKLDENNCEIQALKNIANSPEKVVELPNDCNVMSWDKITDYKDSELKSELLLFWNITNEKKLFYQKDNR
ncbi:MAG TPA: hypothetical protein PLS10_09575, partial [Chitinophagales bacterium]|nr:hypothetical protein [Chitinophagales bacterium]